MENLKKPRWTETGCAKCFVLELLLFLAVALTVQVLESIPVGAAAVIWVLRGGSPAELMRGIPTPLLLVNLYATALGTGAILLFCRFLRKRPPAELGFSCRGAVREYFVGAAVGLALFAGATGLCIAVGALRLTVAENLHVGMWLLFLGGFLLQGMSEEVLLRGYFMGSLLRGYRPWVAVVTNSAAFALLHCFNNGITPLALCNIFLFGVLASLYVLRRGDLWGACAMHSAWNFAQGNLFGISVSGTGAGPSPLSAVANEKLLLWNGGTFGLEGGLGVCFVMLLGIAVLLFLVPNREKKTDGNGGAEPVGLFLSDAR